MYSHIHIMERAKVFKRFSLLVDKIDNTRRGLTVPERSKSAYLNGLYMAADDLIRRLRHLA